MVLIQIQYEKLIVHGPNDVVSRMLRLGQSCFFCGRAEELPVCSWKPGKRVTCESLLVKGAYHWW
jgi:hypothetical protein